MHLLQRAATIVFALFAGTAWADSNFYFGAEAGLTRFDTEAEEYSQPFDDGSLSNQSLDRSNRSRGAVFGFQWDPAWAIEAGYVHLGEYEYDAQSSGAGSFAAGDVESEVEYEGATLAIVYRLNLRNNLALVARAGAFSGSARKTISEGNGNRRATDDIDEGFGGVGVETRLGGSVTGEMGYYYYTGDLGINNVKFRLNVDID